MGKFLLILRVILELLPLIKEVEQVVVGLGQGKAKKAVAMELIKGSGAVAKDRGGLGSTEADAIVDIAEPALEVGVRALNAAGVLNPHGTESAD